MSQQTHHTAGTEGQGEDKRGIVLKEEMGMTNSLQREQDEESMRESWVEEERIWMRNKRIWERKSQNKCSGRWLEFSKGKGDYYGTFGEDDGLVRVD